MLQRDLKLPLNLENELKKVSKVAGYLWQREWAERNAGNISMNLTSFFTKEEVQDIGEEVKELAADLRTKWGDDFLK